MAHPPLKQVGILGSCVTRDAFDFAPVKVAEVAFYIARTNFVSLHSPPLVEGRDFRFELRPGETFSNWRQRIADWELRKVHREQFLRVAPRLDALILDLIDERLETGVLADGRCFVLSQELNTYTAVTAQYSQTRIIIDPIWRQRWVDCAVRFLCDMKRANQSLKIAFHQAPFCRSTDLGEELIEGKYMRSLGGERFLRAFAAAEANLLDSLRLVFPQVSCLSTDPDLHRAAHAHRWGPAPIHYIDEYYREIMRQIEALLADE